MSSNRIIHKETHKKYVIYAILRLATDRFLGIGNDMGQVEIHEYTV